MEKYLARKDNVDGDAGHDAEAGTEYAEHSAGADAEHGARECDAGHESGADADHGAR